MLKMHISMSYLDSWACMTTAKNVVYLHSPSPRPSSSPMENIWIFTLTWTEFSLTSVNSFEEKVCQLSTTNKC
jgi:hypothetical protein